MSARVTEAMVIKARAIIANGIKPSIAMGKVMVAIPDDVVRQALAAALSGEAEGWRSISTAPKDGTWLFLYVPGHGPARARWRARMGWESHNSGREITRATHWRPMFAAPLPEDTHHGR